MGYDCHGNTVLEFENIRKRKRNNPITYIISFFSDRCQDCECVSTFTQISGVYGVVIGGDLKSVYCSFESSHTWTVREMFNFFSLITLKKNLCRTIQLNSSIIQMMNCWGTGTVCTIIRIKNMITFGGA